MNKAKCIIIAASDFNLNYLKKNKNDLLIVCDAGYLNFKKINNLNDNDIDLLIGDFDSLKDVPDNINTIKLNPIKDDTDVCDAIKYALSKGYLDFDLYACIGGRLEHSLANISLLGFLKDNNASARIINGNQIIELLENESKCFDETFTSYFSCFPFSENALVTIKGMKYELENYILKNTFPLGIDNEFINEKSIIEVKQGKVLIIYYKNRG